MTSKRTLILLTVLAAVALAFDAGAGMQLLSLEDPGLILAPVAATTLPQAIKAELDRIGNAFREQGAEILTRVQGLEQEFVALRDAGGVGGGIALADSIGARAAKQFNDDPTFKAAAEAARRDMKPARFEARTNLDQSIRAALVTEEGYDEGTPGDTTIPGRRERSGTYGPVMRPLRLLDALPSRQTDGDVVEHVRVTASGDAEEQFPEGSEKAEIGFEGDLAQANIVTIAGHTTASKQALKSSAALGQIINRVLSRKVLARLENRILNGPGGQGQIEGLWEQSALFVPAIGDTTADRYGEAIVTLANQGFSPNLAIMNPFDWFRLQITKKGDDDASYVFGSPTVPVPPALWNTRIVLTPDLAEGMGMVLDTAYVTVLDREQVSVALSNSHKDNFTKNLITILAELRAGLEVTNQNALFRFPLSAAPVSE